MTIRIKDIIKVLDRISPFKLAEPWDNIGLLVGNPEQETTSILIGLDPTVGLLDEAIAMGANTVITHHPTIFRPLPAIDTATPIGRLLEKALANRIQIIACHTNLDSAENGVNDVLADSFGLVDVVPLRPAGAGMPAGAGLGRIGNFRESLSPDRFLEILFRILDVSCVQIAGRLPDRIGRLALCGGSGSEFAETAFAERADVYLSAEIKHSTARWANECGFCVIDGTHYATEHPVVKHLVARLQQVAENENWDISIRQSTTEAPPFVMQNKDSYIVNATIIKGEEP